jgi:hypothetical protein
VAASMLAQRPNATVHVIPMDIMESGLLLAGGSACKPAPQFGSNRSICFGNNSLPI